MQEAARIAAGKGELEIVKWVLTERERIETEAREKAKAEKLAAGNGGDRSLSGRLSALRKKFGEGKN